MCYFDYTFPILPFFYPLTRTPWKEEASLMEPLSLRFLSPSWSVWQWHKGLAPTTRWPACCISSTSWNSIAAPSPNVQPRLWVYYHCSQSTGRYASLYLAQTRADNPSTPILHIAKMRTSFRFQCQIITPPTTTWHDPNTSSHSFSIESRNWCCFKTSTYPTNLQ